MGTNDALNPQYLLSGNVATGSAHVGGAVQQAPNRKPRHTAPSSRLALTESARSHHQACQQS